MRPILLTLVMLTACAPRNPCQQLKCGANAFCVVEGELALCRCETGFLKNGGQCLANEDERPDAGSTSDAGVDAGIQDAGTQCIGAADCQVGERCSASRCVTEPLVVFVPDASVEVGLRTRLVEGFVLRADGGAATGVRLPETAALSMRQPWLSRPAVDETAAIDATGRFFVPLAAFSSALVPLSTVVDVRAPPAQAAALAVTAIPKGTVSVELIRADGGTAIGVHRRDELLIARVRGPRAFESFANLSAALQPSPSCGCSTDEADAGRCTCFDVELWVPPFPRVDGQLEFGFVVTDVLGNTATPTFADGGPVQVDVTRRLWSLYPQVGQARTAPPIIDDDGVVYLAMWRGANGVVAIRPDGSIKWERVLGTLVTDLAYSRGVDQLDAGDDVIFLTDNFANNNALDGGRLWALSAATGSPLPGSCATSLPRRASSLALVEHADGGPELSAIARFESSVTEPSLFCRWGTSGGVNSEPQSLIGDPVEDPIDPAVFPLPSGRTFVVAKSTDPSAPSVAVYPHFGSTVAVRSIPLVDTNDFGTSTSMTPQPLPWRPAESWGFAFVGGASQTSIGSFALMLRSTVWVVPQQATYGNALAVSHAVVDRQGRLWFTADGALTWVDTVGGTQGELRIPGASIDGSLVLTEDGSGVSDRIYVQGSGALASFRLNPLTFEWLARVNLTPGTLTYDCNRRARGRARQATGVLYSCAVNMITAFIMDSPHLDRQALWPKVQRDVFNTGNTSLRIDNCR